MSVKGRVYLKKTTVIENYENKSLIKREKTLILLPLHFLGDRLEKLNKPSKLYIPSTLNTDYLLWHTQLIVCVVKY